MKKGVFTWSFVMLMSLFLASCSEKESLSVNDFDSSLTKQNPERKYVFAVKPPKGDQIHTRGVGLHRQYWTAGDVIRVKFFHEAPGTQLIQRLVQEYAKIWESMHT